MTSSNASTILLSEHDQVCLSICQTDVCRTKGTSGKLIEYILHTATGNAPTPQLAQQGDWEKRALFMDRREKVSDGGIVDQEQHLLASLGCIMEMVRRLSMLLLRHMVEILCGSTWESLMFDSVEPTYPFLAESCLKVINFFILIGAKKPSTPSTVMSNPWP